jgi:hypothetical protein
MRIIGRVAVVTLAVVVSPAVAAEVQPIQQEMQTAHYRLDLQIGPMEQMYMAADVAAQHLTQGEIMLSGGMAMPKDMDTARHLEVHVYSLDKGAVVSDANVAIAVTDAQKTLQNIQIATMYGITQGPSDTHYGNNVDLPPGTYTIDVTANGEKAAFKVTVPSP